MNTRSVNRRRCRECGSSSSILGRDAAGLLDSVLGMDMHRATTRTKLEAPKMG